MADEVFLENTEASNTNLPIYTDANGHYAGQSFIYATENKVVTAVGLCIYRSGSGGNITVSLYAAGADEKPTGAVLASTTFDASGISTSNVIELFEKVTFDSPYEITAGNRYAIVVSNGPAIANAVRWQVDTTSPSYANGKALQSDDGGSSWTVREWDFRFQVWGQTGSSGGADLPFMQQGNGGPMTWGF